MGMVLLIVATMIAQNLQDCRRSRSQWVLSQTVGMAHCERHNPAIASVMVFWYTVSMAT